MKNAKFILLVSTMFSLCFGANAQALTQTVRGKIMDKNIQTPLIGASVIVVGSEPFNGATTDLDGLFKLENVGIGRQTLKINFLGYKEIILSNVEITSGKQVVLSIYMEENVVSMKEVIVSGKKRRDKAENEMIGVSAKTISAEESQKYAASFNDPGRTVTSVAGVSSVNDGGNNISIRGNSPNGILWRLEGVDVPSPNHFAQTGTSGGGVSILSAQLINNFDFLTGAFPAEYGNAISGVFDLKLRKGNNEKNENTFQVGLLGVDLATEGPFKKGYNGSYLVNYRYSTLGLLSELGLDMGDDVSTFQDLSFNVSLPTKKYGTFSVFGFGGLSSSVREAEKDSSEYDYDYKRYNSNYKSNTGAVGITHSIIFGNKSYLKNSVSLSTTQIAVKEGKLNSEYNEIPTGHMNHNENKQIYSSVFNHKFDSRLSLRTGIILTNNQFDLNLNLQNDTTKVYEQQLDTKDDMQNSEAFMQIQYNITENLTLNAGGHYMHLFLNDESSYEPRASLKWEFVPDNSFSFGYGMHSQLQPISIYNSDLAGASGIVTKQNGNIGFSKAHHYVFGYERMFSSDIHFKTEFYYQKLYNIPVSANSSSSFSMVNNTSPTVYERLSNDGTGKNYGVEVTVEKYLSNGYYGVLTTSLYQSKYKGSDGVERNTRFNGQSTFTFTAGKEFAVSSKRVFEINLKSIYAGGNWDTPIDFEKSQQYGTTYYNDNEAFSVKNPGYYRADLRLSLKTNHAKSTSTWSIDIQNVTSRKNVLAKNYDAQRNEIVTTYQSPLVPVLSYKVNF